MNKTRKIIKIYNRRPFKKTRKVIILPNKTPKNINIIREEISQANSYYPTINENLVSLQSIQGHFINHCNNDL